MAGVLLFGGSFDPIHHGHLISARAAAEALGVSLVILIPGASPPHKAGQRLAPAAVRLAMCKLAVAGDPLFEVSDWELGQPGPSYSLHTVQHFRSVFPPHRALYFLIGMDSLVELDGWYRVGELAEQCTIVTAARPGFAADLSRLQQFLTPEQLATLERHVLATPEIEIAATEIRARVRAGRSIRYLVPESVRAQIVERSLYETE